MSMQVNIDDKERTLRNYLDDVTDQITKLAANDRDDSKTITISDSSATLSASLVHTSDYPIPSVSSSTETAHSAADLESTGIPILHEAIDSKPNQILVYTWFKNDIQVHDISKKKQKVLEVF